MKGPKVYLVMPETDADIVCQSAMKAKLHFQSGTVEGFLLGTERIDEKSHTSYLYIDRERVSHSQIKALQDLKVNSVKVTFILKHWYFQKLRRAVTALPLNIVTKLVPKGVSSFPKQKHKSVSAKEEDESSELLELDDDNKQSAYEDIVNLPGSPMAPYLIVGPFGTGKTRLIAAAVWKLLTESPADRKILIATHHIITANYYVTKYFGPLLRSADSQIKMVRVISDSTAPKGKHGQSDHEFTKTFLEASDGGYFQNCNLIVTTFVVSEAFSRRDIIIGKFTHIFIDEGAQAREPETVAAFRCADQFTKIIIAGDHLQVCILFQYPMQCRYAMHTCACYAYIHVQYMAIYNFNS